MAASSKVIFLFAHGGKICKVFIVLLFSDFSISYCACSTCCNFEQGSEFVACEGENQRSGVEWSENCRASGRFWNNFKDTLFRIKISCSSNVADL